MRSSIISLVALCTIPILAQRGANCDIVASQTVKAGDTLADIAKAANVTLDQFIKAGDVIKIPDKICVAPAAKPLAEPTATCSNGMAKTQTVVARDTLVIIAKEKLEITLPALVAANPQIKNPDAINAGDVIKIPLCNSVTGGGNSSTSRAKVSAAKATKSTDEKVSAKAPQTTSSLTTKTKTKTKSKAPKTTTPADKAILPRQAGTITSTSTSTSRSSTTTKKPKSTKPTAAVAAAAAETTKSKTKSKVPKGSKPPGAAEATNSKSLKVSKAPKATKRAVAQKQSEADFELDGLA
ncbi:hypothetical protein BKA61DRAFT_690830 [Leptodontidium sp. MPI-SDFR-AT-0119]|nr:hypothetical protein BKA61DRAFT_690830 [Leptodontidium sp. MPI-SDFR-AT-0119]